jgi:hypothetical protein
MGDVTINIFPTDPNWTVPHQSAWPEVRKALEGAFPGAEVSLNEFEDVQFLDSGEAMDGIRCNLCGANLEDSFGELMDRAYETGFSTLNFDAPCCGAKTSLADLNFGSEPCGFARSFVSIFEPSSVDVSEGLLATVEAKFETELRLQICPR